MSKNQKTEKQSERDLDAQYRDIKLSAVAGALKHRGNSNRTEPDKQRTARKQPRSGNKTLSD
jgi:monomeric isocitrate dehydrogenase